MAVAEVTQPLALKAPETGETSRVTFYVNGRRWSIESPDPTLLLLDWLRSSEVGLTGTKKGCGQGGCGICTVMLSRWDPVGGKVRHESVNSCLRPLCSVDGMAITTTEGCGSVETALNPVQHRLCLDNGSQCGYCTPGWVMAMTAWLAAHPEAERSQLEIEKLFDGNLCRCTGYRPILYAMRHFASDWTPADEKGSMKCLADPEAPYTGTITAPTPPPPDTTLLRVSREGFTWFRPNSLDAVLDLLAEHDPDNVKLVNGNSSIGIYDRYQEFPRHLIDISRLEALKSFELTPDVLIAGAGITYADLLEGLEGVADSGLLALRYMAERTAGHIVRNVASLAGNTMLVVRHLLRGTPFPSDLFTALACLGAYVELARRGEEHPLVLPILDFAERWQSDEAVRRMVLKAYRIPRTQGDHVQTYKVALREVNAHSIVNAGCRVRFGDKGLVSQAAIVLGGIGPVAFHAERAERALIGQPWSAAALAAALDGLRRDVEENLSRWRTRMSTVLDEGFTDAYRLHLAETYLYKFFVEVALTIGTPAVPASIVSAGRRAPRPLSRGTQTIPPNTDPPPVGLPLIKQDAFLQASGEAFYTHDLPLPPRGVQGAFVLSDRASASFVFQIPDKPGEEVTPQALSDWLRERFIGVTALLTAADVPAGKNNQTAAVASEVGGMDPLFAAGTVEWYGQPIGLLLAEGETQAIDVAHYVRTHCVLYKDGPAPLLTIGQARQAGSVLQDTTHPPFNHILAIERPNSDLSWAGKEGETVLDGARCVVVSGHQKVGAQAHFYMETQSILAIPGERGQMTLYPSTQSPDTIQSSVANLLGVPLASIAVSVKRVGGGYGGKTTRPPYLAAPAALAASILKRAVRIASRREEDMEMFGRRHAYEGAYSLAVATGEDGKAPRGRILGSDMTFWSDGGATYDCSFVVSDCLQMRIDSGYYVPNWRTEGQVARTNLQTSTAFRSMGLIQGVMVLEDAVAAAAHRIGMRAEDLREINLYQPGEETVVGTLLDICYMRQVWAYLRAKADFDARAAAVDLFNAQNRWRKRGIAMIPVQYGAGYNATFLEQAGALVEVYDQDASVLVHQGGVEIGQGLATKIAQVAAETLNLPLSSITIAKTDLQVVPNPVSTGASTGTGFNAESTRAACRKLRERLENYALSLLNKNGPAWCAKQGIDFWNYPEGWKATPKGGTRTIWAAIIGSAHFDRVNLSVQVRIPIPGGGAPAKNLQFSSQATAEQGVDQFTGYTFSAACTEVEIDVLTGETTVLRTDLCYDIGDSLNPAIDIGQVEGAYVQGLGYVLSEELVIQPDGPEAGRLNSNNTWGYKVPATTSIPLEFNVGFFPRAEFGLPTKTNIVLGSKEVGEPPLVLAASVYCALKNAVLAARQDRGETGWFELQGPATVQRVREACLVEIDDLSLS